MKKSVVKIIIVIMICAFAVVGAMVAISLVNARNESVHHAQTKLNYMSQKYAGEFNAEFSNAEFVVDTLAIIAKKEFTVSEYENNRQVFEGKKTELDTIFRKTLDDSEYPIGVYLTFAPETCKGKDEIWYVSRPGGSVKYIDSLLISDGWLGTDNDDADYFYDAIKYGEYWAEAAYDPGNDAEVISYVKPLYDRDEKLIGVIGVDIIVDDLFTMLKTINTETEGDSAIIENGDTVIAGKIPGADKQNQYIGTKSKIGEKWELAIYQPINVATESILRTSAAVIILGILIVIAVCILIVYYSRRTVQPIINEVEKKDLMMINQARQAKMGEMLGNIAHQWKQPLNGMNMALENMRDDYENGELSEDDFNVYVERLRKMISGLTETVDDFTTFLKPARKEERFEAKKEIDNVLHMMEERIKLQGIEVEVTGAETYIDGLKNEFDQCMFNLIDNARDALADHAKATQFIKEHQKIIIETGSYENGDSYISVYNNGSPISVEDKDKIFDLYFTTKDDKEGTGIGLYLTREIVTSHFGGTIHFENADGGVKFVIVIPQERAGENNE